MAAVSVVGALACTESRARAPPAPAALPLGAPRFVRQERDTNGTCQRRGSPCAPILAPTLQGFIQKQDLPVLHQRPLVTLTARTPP